MIVTILLSLWASPIFIIETAGALLLWTFRQVVPIKIHTDPKLPYAWAWLFYVRPNTFLRKYMDKREWKGWGRGNIIVVREDVLAARPAIPLHELRHVWQIMVLGIFKPIISIPTTLVYRILYGAKLGYWLNPFEQDCYRFSGETELMNQRIQELRQLRHWSPSVPNR
ncbi:hypothetical protein JXA59_03135 [Patescibacteria group bacterium]|nr:hypothetical protein [Patescibacteria group bacterium]